MWFWSSDRQVGRYFLNGLVKVKKQRKWLCVKPSSRLREKRRDRFGERRKREFCLDSTLMIVGSLFENQLRRERPVEPIHKKSGLAIHFTSSFEQDVRMMLVDHSMVTRVW